MADAAANGGGGNVCPVASLYVADLDRDVTDEQLFDMFNKVGMLISVRVCKDSITRRSLGYAYVNYNYPQDAERAVECLNFAQLGGRSIRVMYCNRDPRTRRNGTANIFIKNLDKTIDNKALYDLFSSFGNILSCKIATDDAGQFKGYGFVQFDNEASAQKAIDKLNNILLNDKQVFVGHFRSKLERETVLDKLKCTNVFVKNLSESMMDEDLLKIFGEYGPIISAVVMTDEDGKSKCFGFVNFDSADAADKAVEALNGKKFGKKCWYVGKAQKKSERELELKSRLDQSPTERVDKFRGLNLYIKNLHDSIDDDKFKEIFLEFGTITSCKVMRDSSGMSRGSGFVAFSTPEEASHAFVEMNGKMVVGKPLYVAIAQPKEERIARLQAQKLQMQSIATAPSVAPRVPMFTPAAPVLRQQLVYGQAPRPPQAGFGYPQQLVPGMTPGDAPKPNSFVPMVQQGQQGPRSGARRGAWPVHQLQQPITTMQQQMLSRGRVYNYPTRLPEVPMPGVAGSMLSTPYDMVHQDASHMMPVPAFGSALADASLEQQRTVW